MIRLRNNSWSSDEGFRDTVTVSVLKILYTEFVNFKKRKTITKRSVVHRPTAFDKNPSENQHTLGMEMTFGTHKTSSAVAISP